MKKIIILIVIALYSGVSFPASVTIINSGFAFSPDNVAINFGDTVIFQLGSIHNAVEVSEATWLANGNTPLPGFSTPFGGGQVFNLSTGIHYYVCAPHASGGMKGRITVNALSGISDDKGDSEMFRIYPNPTSGKFILQFVGSSHRGGNLSGTEQPVCMEISDILGKRIFTFQDFVLQKSYQIDLSSVPHGIYFVSISDKKRIYTEKLVKY